MTIADYGYARSNWLHTTPPSIGSEGFDSFAIFKLLGRRECPIGCNVWSADYPSARKGTRAHYRHAFGGCRIPPSGQALVGGCQGERRLPLSSACRVFEVDHGESGARIDG